MDGWIDGWMDGYKCMERERQRGGGERETFTPMPFVLQSD